VSWQFERKGVVVVTGGDEDKVMEVATEAGAEDLNGDGGRFVVTCAPNDLNALRAALEGAGLSVESAELSLEPTATVAVADEADAKRVLRLLEAIDDHDDVQAVHANYDIADEVLAGFYA
jgi:transcriptional/translational regulatory protein YebC/TACO1